MHARVFVLETKSPGLDAREDIERAPGKSACADLERRHELAAGLSPRSRLAPRMSPLNLARADHRASLARFAESTDRVVGQLAHVMDESIEVATECAVEEWRRCEYERQSFGMRIRVVIHIRSLEPNGAAA